MSQSTDQVRGLLRTTVDQLPGGPIDAPVAGLLVRARRGQRRRRVAQTGAVVLAVVAAIVVPVAIIGGHTAQTATPLPGYSIPAVTTPSVTAAQLARGKWTTLPAAPIDGRTYPATAWTGTRMLVWGGASGDGSRGYADGASYDPQTRQWQKLPTGPLSARAEMASVWTGSGLFVWGGVLNSDQSQVAHDGALYDPATRTWRTIAPSPLAGRSGATAVWTGGQVVVIGGAPPATDNPVRTDLDVAAYDPATDEWHRLPSLPVPSTWTTDYLTAVATPAGIDVWAYWEHYVTTKDGRAGTAGIMHMQYDPRSGQWHTVTEAPVQDLGNPLLTSNGLIFPATQPFRGAVPGPMASDTSGWRWDAATGTWHRLPHGPVDDLRADSVWTGAALLSFNTGTLTSGPDGTTYPGAAAVWDPTTDRWTKLPDAPLLGSGPAEVWTGTELIEWGLMRPTHNVDGNPVTGGLTFGSS